MSRSRIALLAATTLAAVYAAGLYAEGAWAPAACCGLTWPTPDPTQADRLAVSEDPTGADPAIQRRAALAQLGARPADSRAWLRLAHADRLAHGGRLGAEGRRAIDMSYLVQPYADPATGSWRLGMALSVWSQLDPRTRQDALKDLRTGDRAVYRQAVVDALPGVRDPQGRAVGLRYVILSGAAGG